ncbi:MAG: hypothetical protein M4579_000122 [Chaenotheca gracillima]|nr:MAG: hypothetical protein M4579_000122 [Chaenotheca gracillima]
MLARSGAGARIYTRLNEDGVSHPCILRHVENRDDGIVLGLASGGNLRTYFHEVKCAGDDGPSDSKRLKWARRLAEALSFVHSRGVLQVDIGGHNVFLDDRGGALLGDFSGSSIDGSEPMCCAGDGFYHPSISGATKETDIFSFGSLLFELMTGTKPPVEVSKGQFPSLDKLQKLDKVIVECWQGKYVSMDEVVNDICAEINFEKEFDVS